MTKSVTESGKPMLKVKFLDCKVWNQQQQWMETVKALLLFFHRKRPRHHHIIIIDHLTWHKNPIIENDQTSPI
jgi:hypothetical protein